MTKFASHRVIITLGLATCIWSTTLTANEAKISLKLGSFIGETDFTARLESHEACMPTFRVGCNGSAVAELEKELTRDFEVLKKLADAQPTQIDIRPVRVSSFSILKPAYTDLDQPEVHSEQAFNLTIPIATTGITNSRQPKENMSSFTFSNSYAYVE